MSPSETEPVAKDEDDSGGSALFPRGNPFRWVRGGLTTVAGSLGAFLLMADDRQLRVGVPLGIAFVAIAAFGVMDLVGSFDDDDQDVVSSTTLARLVAPLANIAVALVVFGLTLAGAASGLLRPWIWGILVTLAFVGLVFSVFQLGEKLGVTTSHSDDERAPRSIWEREGFWVVLASALLLLPCMGSYSLWDPWETHYGEVAREILARDDWISLWWAQDGWFWSKPVLDFWIQAIFMATLGVHYEPDQMLRGIGGREAHPEWVVRAPVVLLAILAIYILYKGVAKVFGRRAGLLGALILATMPDWWCLAHQTMTDMPFVAPTTCAMGLMLVGLYTPEDRKVRLYEVKTGDRVWRLSAWHLVFGAILVAALPQILYLFSRNLELVLHGPGTHGLRAHYDEFRSGSGLGNCGLPGNEACGTGIVALLPANLRAAPVGLGAAIVRFVLGYEPTLQALTWCVVLGFLLYLNWGERRARRVAYLGAWFFAAVATLGKGPAGFALPVLAGLAYVATTKRWSELVRFELVSGLSILLVVAIPWGMAMYVRHGQAFTSRLITHDMFERAFSHVHDTNEGDDTSFRFYVWQLGYALFPWTGLAPLGLVYSLRRSETADRSRAEASILLLMWFLFAFALFSFMGTKFHHYILPAVPPIAMLLGITLDDLLGEGPILVPPSHRTHNASAAPAEMATYLLLLTTACAVAVAGVARAWPGSIAGDRPSGNLRPPSYWLSATLCAAAALVFALAVTRFRTREARSEDSSDLETDAGRRAWHAQLMFAGATVAGALILAIVGRDLIVKPDGAQDPGAIRIVHLFTYNYRRPWPDALDFSAVLTGFTVVGVLLGLLLMFGRIRKHLIIGFLAFAMVWAVWGLDVYMVKTAQHWGQHEILATYYADRSGPNEPFVAYQMNWKGENFYTGNRVPAFVSSGAAFTRWLKEQREKGVHVVYFVTEHSRVGGLKSEVQGKTFREVTDKTLNNKFVLVRAEI